MNLSPCLRIFAAFAFAIITLSAAAQRAVTVIANPGENAAKEVNINWHTPLDGGKSTLQYTTADDAAWAKSRQVKAKQQTCTAFDSMYSKAANGENFYEDARFTRNTASLRKLRPGTKYMYRIDNDTLVRYFRTAPAADSGFTAAIISDFHCYPPLAGRQRAAMAMLDTLERIHGGEFDLMIHLGDVCAWGGSYSFWRQLYDEPHFRNNTWAGVNGNHDNMDRTNKRNSNQFFANTNANPLNGYAGEEGVCYYFRYGDVLFIALNSEAMRTDEGLAEAQQWVRRVIKENPAQSVVVMEHYQWFFGQSGKDSQYPRWRQLFDECGVDLALGANNHRYASTHPLRDGQVVAPGQGTVYIQTPSSDDERGVGVDEIQYNADIIKTRWSEGSRTVGAMIMDVDPQGGITVSLYDRNGLLIDRNKVK